MNSFLFESTELQFGDKNGGFITRDGFFYSLQKIIKWPCLLVFDFVRQLQFIIKNEPKSSKNIT